MYKVGGVCPICQETMRVERLRCPNCGTALEGSFTLSPLFSLPAERLRFVEMLVKHRGNIQRVAEEMEVSYRTARTRMDEIATELGYALPPDSRPSPERRREILQDLESGTLSAEEAAQLLQGKEE